jgi:hypothetical protein
MLANVPEPVQATHDGAGNHAAHHEHAAADSGERTAPPGAPCPHCPLEAGAANSGHATCVAIDGHGDGSAQPKAPLDRPLPPVVLSNWLLPAARAAPPLIGPLERTSEPVTAAVALNIRHCVLLI